MIKNPETAYSKREKIPDIFSGSKGNDVYTPEEAILPLISFLDKSKIIWDCAYGGGEIGRAF